MNPKTTALVLIEYQNDFTTEGGALHGAVKPVMDSTNMLANTVKTVAAARHTETLALQTSPGPDNAPADPTQRDKP